MTGQHVRRAALVGAAAAEQVGPEDRDPQRPDDDEREHERRRRRGRRRAARGGSAPSSRAAQTEQERSAAQPVVLDRDERAGDDRLDGDEQPVELGVVEAAGPRSRSRGTSRSREERRRRRSAPAARRRSRPTRRRARRPRAAARGRAGCGATTRAPGLDRSARDTSTTRQVTDCRLARSGRRADGHRRSVPEAAPIVDGWRERTCAIAVHRHPAARDAALPVRASEEVDESELATCGVCSPRRRRSTSPSERRDAFRRRSTSPRSRAEPFVRLTEAIVERWPDYPPYDGVFDTIVPHLAVAHGERRCLGRGGGRGPPEAPARGGRA